MAGFRASQAASWLQAQPQLQRIGAREHVQSHGLGNAIAVLGPAPQLIFKFIDVADPVHDSLGTHFGQVLDEFRRSAAAGRVEHGYPGALREAALRDFHGGQVPRVEFGFVFVQAAGVAAGPEDGFAREFQSPGGTGAGHCQREEAVAAVEVQHGQGWFGQPLLSDFEHDGNHVRVDLTEAKRRIMQILSGGQVAVAV